MSTDAAKPATSAPVKLPPWLHWHTVPRDLRWTLPAGWQWCGPMVERGLRNGSPSFIVSEALWPEEVRQHMEGAVVVSAVLAIVEPETVFAWSGFLPEGTGSDWLHPRQPRLLEFPKGHALRITMKQCRQGEVLTWPVRRIAQGTP